MRPLKIPSSTRDCTQTHSKQPARECYKEWPVMIWTANVRNSWDAENTHYTQFQFVIYS